MTPDERDRLAQLKLHRPRKGTPAYDELILLDNKRVQEQENISNAVYLFVVFMLIVLAVIAAVALAGAYG